VLKLRKIVRAVVLTAFVAHLIVLFCIDSYCWSNLPRVADEQTARTTRIVFHHGSVRYGSERESQALKLTESVMPFTIMGLLVIVMWGFLSGDFPIRGRTNHQPTKIVES
jgi:hypothetical protein